MSDHEPRPDALLETDEGVVDLSAPEGTEEYERAQEAVMREGGGSDTGAGGRGTTER